MGSGLGREKGDNGRHTMNVTTGVWRGEKTDSCRWQTDGGPGCCHLIAELCG